MTEYQEISTVLETQRLSESVFRLHLQAPRIALAARPGQFVMAQTGTSLDPLLRRPFSIHKVSDDGSLHLLFKVIGRGTGFLAELRHGQPLDLLGPLGRGFQQPPDGPVCLVGGGMGIAPLVFLAQHVKRAFHRDTGDQILLGARNGDELAPLVDDFIALGHQPVLATDDGSLGHHGFVSALLPPLLSQFSKVYVCGPWAMMAAVAALCRAAAVPCEASLETHMACGLGACLGCTILGADGNYRHVCAHGPVLDAQEVAWTP